MIIIDIPAAPNFSAVIRPAVIGGYTGEGKQKPQTRSEIKNAV